MGSAASFFHLENASEQRNSIRQDNGDLRHNHKSNRYFRMTRLRKSNGRPTTSPSSQTSSKSKSVKCSCCHKKFNLMDSIRKLSPKRRYCANCHKEVCKKCYAQRTCHKCSSGVRKETVTDLQSMDRPQLLRILDQLHYEGQTIEIQETSDLILAILNQCDMDTEFVKEFEASHTRLNTHQAEINRQEEPEVNQIQNNNNTDETQNPYEYGQPRFVDTLSCKSTSNVSVTGSLVAHSTPEVRTPAAEALNVVNEVLKLDKELVKIAEESQSSDLGDKLAAEFDAIVANAEPGTSRIGTELLTAESSVPDVQLSRSSVEDDLGAKIGDDKSSVDVLAGKQTLLKRQVSCVTPFDNVCEDGDVVKPLRSSSVRRSSQSEENICKEKPLKTSTPLLSRTSSYSLRSLTSAKSFEEMDIQRLRQILDRALENVTEQELAIIVTNLWKIRQQLKPKEQKVRISMIGSLGDIAVPDVISSLTIRQIKMILDQHLVSYEECSEKHEMVQKLIRLWEDANKRAEEKEDVPKGEQCVICLTERANCVFQDCGHLVTCTECVTNIKECPVCRLYIVKVIRIFRA